MYGGSKTQIKHCGQKCDSWRMMEERIGMVKEEEDTGDGEREEATMRNERIDGGDNGRKDEFEKGNKGVGREKDGGTLKGKKRWMERREVIRQLKQSTGTLDSPDCISSLHYITHTHTHTQFRGEVRLAGPTRSSLVAGWETLPCLP